MSMRSFENMANLIRSKRMNHPKGYSQSELSQLLGYKNGQFISNVERALCNIPLKMLARVSEILNIPPDDLKRAILLDQEKTIDNYLRRGQAQRASDFKKDAENRDFSYGPREGEEKLQNSNVERVKSPFSA